MPLVSSPSASIFCASCSEACAAASSSLPLQQGGLAVFEGAACLVALDDRAVGPGVCANARGQFDTVRPFDEVIHGPGGKALRFRPRVVVRGHHDDGHVSQLRVRFQLADDFQPVDHRHVQVDQDHRRRAGLRIRERARRVNQVVDGNVRFGREHSAHQVGIERLVVDEQQAGVAGLVRHGGHPFAQPHRAGGTGVSSAMLTCSCSRS
nr:hypothetical protein [Massilia sp. Se16.2.3]